MILFLRKEKKSYLCTRNQEADMAQLVEHFIRNERVRGSSPRVGSAEQDVQNEAHPVFVFCLSLPRGMKGVRSRRKRADADCVVILCAQTRLVLRKTVGVLAQDGRGLCARFSVGCRRELPVGADRDSGTCCLSGSSVCFALIFNRMNREYPRWLYAVDERCLIFSALQSQ